MTGIISKRDFNCVGKFKIISKKMSQNSSSRIGNNRMSAGKFRERRSLDKGNPVFVYVPVYHCYRPYQVGLVFFIPTSNKSIENTDCGKGIYLCSFGYLNVFFYRLPVQSISSAHLVKFYE